MSAGKEESLSPDEMRQKLYQTFKSRGLLDALKTQMRNQLIQELQPAAVRRADAHSVLVTACNSAVVHHLRSAGCDYTLSVFLPECGLTKDQVLSARELLQLMKISPHTPLYKSLASNVQEGRTGFLMGLFTELTEHHVHRDRRDASTQSTSVSAHKESLVEKLQLIDEEYEVLRSRGDRWATVEVKLAEHRKEIQEQAQVELQAKLQHFMEVEIAKVKRDEKEASRREVLELRRDAERTLELKTEALMSREKNAIERLQKQQEIEEKEIYAQRQALLKDIETVRSREVELKQRTEAFDKTCKLHEEKVKTMDDLLRRRELSVKTMEDTFDQKLKSEVVKYQLELKEDYVKRTEKLTENEKRIKEETVRLQKESAIFDAKAEEHERSLSEAKRLLMELEASRTQASLLTQQNELLRERLENLSDYPALKKDALELQTHVRLLEQHLEEKNQENQRLRRELSAPSKEQLALQAELRRLETARKLDLDELETQKSVLHTQLQHEVQQCGLLKSQLMECEERVKWMNSHAEELKLQLQQTQQDSALLRKPRAASDANLCEAGPALRGPGPAERDSELVSGALARIRELEQEAERLEEAYRSHRHRLTCRAPARVSFASAGRPVERTPSPRPVSPPARRLSSTPLRRHGADAQHHSFTQDSALLISSISPPLTPSPPEQPEVTSSSSEESSPPQKITLHDLSDLATLLSVDQECVLEKLQESHTDEDAEERKKREEREERKRREEREEREERGLVDRRDEEQTRGERQDTEGHVTLPIAVIGGGAEEEGSGGADLTNPLHKYMMMLTQDREKQQSPNKEASEKQSHEEVLQSENNEHSLDLMSHEEPDDDFW
ncbi:oral-facial-digital syndrome 1 protein homolog isoform X2 [Puntigrus tetrazona]|uniref:oral-facial-digital syndrome 1 protein homolog isoform X2 n=1 Tax=Puntigrus tetrazona TaxID=1606681 RepID=UPI001C8AF8CC|nr:oral-facial-digital syndrome 1 protein homolog isoform X2 [Puntigrus tetrazona]